MTEEEYFRKTYPDYCYGDRQLSPYWDFFQDGVEFGERQSEKKSEELEQELTVEKDQLQEETNLHLHAENYIKSLEEELTKKADTNHSLVEQMADLEQENERLKGELELWESGACRATNLFKCGVVKELKEQIEKMKCWCNCKNYQQCLIELAEQGKGMKSSECCVNCKKWEIEENE